MNDGTLFFRVTVLAALIYCQADAFVAGSGQALSADPAHSRLFGIRVRKNFGLASDKILSGRQSGEEGSALAAGSDKTKDKIRSRRDKDEIVQIKSSGITGRTRDGGSGRTKSLTDGEVKGGGSGRTKSLAIGEAKGGGSGRTKSLAIGEAKGAGGSGRTKSLAIGEAKGAGGSGRTRSLTDSEAKGGGSDQRNNSIISRSRSRGSNQAKSLIMYNPMEEDSSGETKSQDADKVSSQGRIQTRNESTSNRTSQDGSEVNGDSYERLQSNVSNSIQNARDSSLYASLGNGDSTTSTGGRESTAKSNIGSEFENPITTSGPIVSGRRADRQTASRRETSTFSNEKPPKKNSEKRWNFLALIFLIGIVLSLVFIFFRPVCKAKVSNCLQFCALCCTSGRSSQQGRKLPDDKNEETSTMLQKSVGPDNSCATCESRSATDSGVSVNMPQ